MGEERTEVSGIYGFVKIGNDDDTIAEGRVRGLRRWNRDYGRDGEGEVTGEGFAVGNFVEHFAEVFPAGAPVFEDENQIYAIDAVIYNRDELDASQGESDEELIIDIIKNKGYPALKDINGDFTGAVLDKETGDLKLFRDHLGVRPLYYYLKDGLLAFSTDIRGLGALPDANLKIDEEMVWLMMAGYCDLNIDRTHFEYIRCVLPGSIMTFKGKSSSFSVYTEKFFNPGQKKIRLKTDDDYIAEMRTLIEDSIKRRLDAFPGRIGAELSGGLDSSVIDIIINRMRPGGKYVAWRFVPDDWPIQPEDERTVIKDVAEQEGLDYEFLSEMHPDEVEDGKAVPVFSNTCYLGETAKLVSEKGIRVMFSGQGGDEGVSHRCSSLEIFRAREYRSYIRELWHETEHRRLRVLRFFFHLGKQILVEYPGRLRPMRMECNCISVLQKDLVQKMKSKKGGVFYFDLDPVRWFLSGGIRTRPETAAYQSAKFGVRYVFPYEDYRVFDYALSIPRNLYLRNGVDRWIYRKAFDDIMPESLKNVFYKDFPSLRNKDSEASLDYSDAFAWTADKLDGDRWNDYIDLDLLKKFTQTEEQDKTDEHWLAEILMRLYTLILIQNFQDFCR